jgi:hypothetical protein
MQQLRQSPRLGQDLSAIGAGPEVLVDVGNFFPAQLIIPKERNQGTIVIAGANSVASALSPQDN